MPVSVFLVSDSTIFASAMEQAIATEFAQVSRSSSLSNVISLEIDWHDSVVIVDAGNPKDLVSQLTRNRESIEAAHIIVLMRANQSIDDYRPIIGMIGGLLPDGATLQEIALAARIVRHGITLLPTVAIATLRPTEADGESIDARSFTDREHAVLGLISQGASNKVIGRKLDITESTVRVHVRAILRKLGMQNRTQAALYAVSHKAGQVGSDFFRPVNGMLSCIAGFIVVNSRPFLTEAATDIQLLQMAAIL